MTTPQPENRILDGTIVTNLIDAVRDQFEVEDMQVPKEAPQGTLVFIGQLFDRDSERAYDRIAEQWRPLHYTPMLRRYENRIALQATPGIIAPKPTNPWINLATFLITLVSMVFTGAVFECGCMPSTADEWLGGIPMMLAMMSILLAHEFGHYFAARYHKISVTLPYLIPLPILSPVGTLGAVIQLRSPFKTKKELFDVGVAGPLAGLVVVLPLIFWGISISPIDSFTRDTGGALEGNSIFYLWAKYVVHGEILPAFDAFAGLSEWQQVFYLLLGSLPAGGGTDIQLNMFTLAAWFGLFITAMNLLPVGQLDGGHVIYCLIGDKAKPLGLALVVVMVIAGFFSWPGWLLWAALVYFMIGTGHPPPLNDLVELDISRKMIAYATIIIFFLLFMPNPFQEL